MTLLDKINQIKATNFELLWIKSYEFMPSLKAEVEERFPNESQPWEVLPTYHALFGSTVRPDENRTINDEVREFIEREIANMLAELK